VPRSSSVACATSAGEGTVGAPQQSHIISSNDHSAALTTEKGYEQPCQH
jgi:hypothetical protein